VHQEKQLVQGTGIDCMKQLTGKHCSLRWKAMCPEEKALYEALESVGSGVWKK
jgi:hypothetical protein